MRKILLFVALLLLVSLPAQAQDGYRLRVPTAEEYVAALPNVRLLSDDFRSNYASYLVKAEEAEFLYRYADDVDSMTLQNAFEKLKVGTSYYWRDHIYLPVIDYNFWVAWLVQAWLDEHPTDLDQVSSLSFLDYLITIERRDFTDDGRHEWLLRVIKEPESVQYDNYLVVNRSPTGYRVVNIPIPWREAGYSTRVPYGRPITETVFDDINADGRPEWILTSKFAVDINSIIYNWVITYVLEWRGGQITRLAMIDDYARLPDIVNVDDDLALEIVYDRVNSDNWGCGYIVVYDWDGEAYRESSPRLNEDTCHARHAEEAMWTGDYQTAAILYEQLIIERKPAYEAYLECEAPHLDRQCGTYGSVLFEYFVLRRIVAYAMLGDRQRVDALLAELQTPPFDSTAASSIFAQHVTDAESICQAAYDYYASQNKYALEDLYYQYDVLLGVVREDRGFDPLDSVIFDPARIGCDISLLFATPTPNSTVTPLPTTTSDTRPRTEILIDSENVVSAFKEGDYPTVLTIAQRAVPRDDMDMQRWGYWRALALEALNRPDEALAEYVAIYEAAPESAWGMLAALHIEKVNP
ncbi:MAG: hypothetical protein K8I60_11050 [Anaerolineae bacterium]|nr:hypothetical protein [Anaerolineae bacterium]